LSSEANDKSRVLTWCQNLNSNSNLTNGKSISDSTSDAMAVSHSPTPTSLTHLPPPLLSSLPPLARLLNSIAFSLNELRLFPAISLLPIVYRALMSVFAGVAKSLSEFIAGGEGEDKHLRLALSKAFRQLVVPWTENALLRVVYCNLPPTLTECVGTMIESKKTRVALDRLEAKEIEISSGSVSQS